MSLPWVTGRLDFNIWRNINWCIIVLNLFTYHLKLCRYMGRFKRQVQKCFDGCGEDDFCHSYGVHWLQLINHSSRRAEFPVILWKSLAQGFWLDPHWLTLRLIDPSTDPSTDPVRLGQWQHCLSSSSGPYESLACRVLIRYYLLYESALCKILS